MLLGAKITDVLIAVQPPPAQGAQAEHWVRLRDYYSNYEAFLLRLFKRADMLLSTDIEEFVAATARLKQLDERTDELVEIWTERVKLYTAMRQVVQRGNDLFDVYEDIFVFTARFDVFNARRGPGIEFLQSVMHERVQERLALVERLYIQGSETADEDFAAMQKLDRTLAAYMKMYDSEDVVRVAYSAMARAMQTREKQAVAIGRLLDQVCATMAVETVSLESSLRARALLRQVAPMVGLLEATPLVVYRNDRLEFAESGWPVTTDAPLKMERVDRALMEQRSVAQWDLLAGEFITANQRVIALVPDGVDLDSLVRADLRGPLVAVEFDRFRVVGGGGGGGGNCVVRRVVVQARAFHILVTTRAVRSGEPLLRAYTDTELYKIWLSHNETLQPVGGTTTREYRARQHINELQLSRLQVMGEEDTEENKLIALDYRIRIDLLTSLLLNKK